MATADDALLKALEEDSCGQGRRILQEAEDAAASILSAARKEALALKEERLKAFRGDMEKKRARAINAARTRAGGVILEARREAINGVVDAAVELCRSLPRDERAALLNSLYEELEGSWPAQAGEPAVLVNPADAPLLGDKGPRVMPDEGVGVGVVFVSEDSRIRFENTVLSRIKAAGAELETLIDRLLFSD